MVDYHRTLYPFVGSYLNLDGIHMHYLDEGAGEPVVMLHGNPTWSFYYRNLIMGLRDKFRTIAPDHVGCGFSDKPNENRYEYTLDRRARDLASLLDHLKVNERVTLVVHDWGGMIGMTYASRFPERIARLVLLNTAAFHLPTTKQLPPSLWLCRKTPLDDFIVRQSGLFGRMVTRWGCRRQPMPAQVRDGYLSPHRSADRRVGQLKFVQDIPLRPDDKSYALVSEVQERLSVFRKTPTLILWGDKDWVFDHHFLNEWQRILPAAEVHRFPEAGHLVLEDAGEEILPIMRGFFEKHPCS